MTIRTRLKQGQPGRLGPGSWVPSCNCAEDDCSHQDLLLAGGGGAAAGGATAAATGGGGPGAGQGAAAAAAATGGAPEGAPGQAALPFRLAGMQKANAGGLLALEPEVEPEVALAVGETVLLLHPPSSPC